MDVKPHPPISPWHHPVTTFFSFFCAAFAAVSAAALLLQFLVLLLILHGFSVSGTSATFAHAGVAATNAFFVVWLFFSFSCWYHCCYSYCATAAAMRQRMLYLVTLHKPRVLHSQDCLGNFF